MSYQPKNNSGSCFRNDRKREGKEDADFAGSVTIEGKEYWMDMWQKAPKEGKKGFFSISFRPKAPSQQKTGEKDDYREFQKANPTHKAPVPPSMQQPAEPEQMNPDGTYKF